MFREVKTLRDDYKETVRKVRSLSCEELYKLVDELRMVRDRVHHLVTHFMLTGYIHVATLELRRRCPKLYESLAKKWREKYAGVQIPGEKECDFCGEQATHTFPFKILGRSVDWEVCSNCLETLRSQLENPTPKEKAIQAPKGAYVFPAYCQFCGKSIEFNPDTWRFEEKVYTLDMVYYYVDICDPCRKEMLDAVNKARKV